MRPLKIIALAALCLLAACVQNRSFNEGLSDVGADLTLKRQLLFDNDIKTADVDLAVYEGRLLMAGTVPSEADYQGLLQRAQSIGGVREIVDEVRIGAKTTLAQGRKDAVIDNKLGFALRADNGVYRDNYKIVVSQGTVYLLGVAQGPNELQRVTGHASSIDGVTNVVSHVIFVGDPRRQPQR